MKYFLTLLAGIIVGAVLVFLFFTGAPRAKAIPGSPIKPPEQGGPPPGTAIVSLDERFFDAVLGAIFKDRHNTSSRVLIIGEISTLPTR